MKRDDFITAMMPHAQRVSQTTGIDPRIVIAQSALETGWGRSAPGNNFFGIKSHGKSGGGTYNTWEVIDGQRVNVADSFRGYGSMGESADDYGRFLKENPRYQPMLKAQGLDAQIDPLAASGYATDPDYGRKIASIASSIGGEPSSVSASSPLRLPAISTQGKAPASLLEAPDMNTAQPLAGGLLGDGFTPDKRDRIILALEGMTMNPNRGLMMAAADGLQERRDARKDAQAEQKAAKRTNRTIEWLNSQGEYGRRLAQAVSSG